MPGERRYAVLMGDLVGSSSAPDRRALHERFNRLVADANERCAADLASPLTITLGDEFQGLAFTLAAAFRLNRLLRLGLLLEGTAARFVVGTAVIESPLNPSNAWNMMGSGLAEARAKLGDKKDDNCYRFSFPERAELELALDGLGRSLTRVESDWTETQLKYVARVLTEPGKPRSDLARDLGVSENSLYKVLRSAEFRYYLQQIETVEAVLGLEDLRSV